MSELSSQIWHWPRFDMLEPSNDIVYVCNQVYPLADGLEPLIFMLVKLNLESNLKQAINILRVVVIASAHRV